MTCILILQPARPTNPPMLRRRAAALLARMVEACSEFTFDIAQEDVSIPVQHPSRYAPHAAARNYMLDRYLKEEHTHVLWVDSDLVEYPADLPRLLMAVGGVCAPLVYLDASEDRLRFDSNPLRFYDVGGFIEAGKRAEYYPPHFVQGGAVIDMDSVGCCYLAPASLYRDETLPGESNEIYTSQHFFRAARYQPAPTDLFVEHWSVCQAALRRGYRVCALTTVRAIHAWLPDYGLGVN